MRVIFLDVDGVLNSDAYLKDNIEEIGYGEDWATMISRPMVARLNSIVAQTGAKVVLSSSWRVGFPFVTEFQEMMVKKGFLGEVIDKTPTNRGLYELLQFFTEEQQLEFFGEDTMWTRQGVSFYVRGHQIKAWLLANRAPVEEFIILDDENDMVYLTDHLVMTTWEHGLQDEHVELAVRKLGC